MRAMRLLLPLASIASVQASRMAPASSIYLIASRRWQGRRSTWDVPKRNGLTRRGVAYYQPPTLKQPDLESGESPGDVDAGDKPESTDAECRLPRKGAPGPSGRAMPLFTEKGRPSYSKVELYHVSTCL